VRGVAFVGVVLVLALVVSQSCQKSQIRVTKEQAIARAERQIDFDPTRTQIRLLRQGLNSRPNWIVSLSIPKPGTGVDTQQFSELAIVTIDANTGKVAQVKIQR
jgi:phosphohistidine swiveling domain-containing protein